MKRQLLQNVKTLPYASGDTLDREGFLSAVLGGKITSAGTLKLTVTHSDDGTTFEPVADELVFPEKYTKGGAYESEALEAGSQVNIDMDLVGLKKYIQIAISGDAASGASFAVALGDSGEEPV